jgi:hypothetical protein
MEQRISAVAGDSSREQIVTHWLPPFEFQDTLTVRVGDLAPVEERAASSALRFHYQYQGRRVTGTMQRRDSAARPIDVTFGEPVFAFNQLDELVSALAFRRGMRVVIPLFSEADAALEHDTLSVLGDTMANGERTWRIRFADPVIVSRYLVDARSREIIDTETRQRRSAMAFHLVPDTADLPRVAP